MGTTVELVASDVYEVMADAMAGLGMAMEGQCEALARAASGKGSFEAVWERVVEVEGRLGVLRDVDAVIALAIDVLDEEGAAPKWVPVSASAMESLTRAAVMMGAAWGHASSIAAALRYATHCLSMVFA